MACTYRIVIVVFLMNFILLSLADEEKPLDCPVNEEYYKCSLEVCYKKCEDIKRPPPCPAIASGCFLPSCECIKDYLRKSDGICVLVDKCCKYSQQYNNTVDF